MIRWVKRPGAPPFRSTLAIGWGIVCGSKRPLSSTHPKPPSSRPKAALLPPQWRDPRISLLLLPLLLPLLLRLPVLPNTPQKPSSRPKAALLPPQWRDPRISLLLLPVSSLLIARCSKLVHKNAVAVTHPALIPPSSPFLFFKSTPITNNKSITYPTSPPKTQQKAVKPLTLWKTSQLIKTKEKIVENNWHSSFSQFGKIELTEKSRSRPGYPAGPSHLTHKIREVQT